MIGLLMLQLYVSQLEPPTVAQLMAASMPDADAPAELRSDCPIGFRWIAVSDGGADFVCWAPVKAERFHVLTSATINKDSLDMSDVDAVEVEAVPLDTNPR